MCGHSLAEWRVAPGWLLSAGAPCFSRGSDALASRKESHFDQSGFSPGGIAFLLDVLLED
jgi:hypothetical protein